MEEKLVLINEENGCDEKSNIVTKKVQSAKTFTSNKFSEVFQETEHTKDKMSENDPNFQRSKIHQDTENIYTSYYKL